MKTIEILNQFPVLDAAQSQELHQSESLIKPTPSENIEIPTSAWLVSGMCGAIVVAISVFSLKRFFTRDRKQDHTNNWNCHQHIPCHNCRFSSRNSYLKCAVHPTKAMKKDAIGCTDYWAKDSDTFSQ